MIKVDHSIREDITGDDLRKFSEVIAKIWLFWLWVFLWANFVIQTVDILKDDYKQES